MAIVDSQNSASAMNKYFDGSGGPLSDSASPPGSPSQHETFQKLAKQWRDETGMLSSVAKKLEHSAYRQIVSLGPPIIPWVLEELLDRPSYWFAALRELAKDLPNVPKNSGDFNTVREQWLNWGKERGMIP